MKKRLLALTIVLAMCAAFVVPGLSADSTDSVWATAGTYTSLGVVLDDTLRVKLPGAGTGTSYSLMKAKDIADGKKISWKAFKEADIAADGTVEFGKIITGLKEDMVLYFTSADIAKKPTDTTPGVKDATPGSLDAFKTQLKSFNIGKAAAAPKKLAVEYSDHNGCEPVYKIVIYDENGDEVKTEDGAKAYEWTLSNDVNGWTKFTKLSQTFPVKPYAQEIWVRLAGTADAPPSAYKVAKVAALAVPSNIKQDFAKGVLSGFKENMYVSATSSGTGSKLTKNGAQSVTVGTNTSISTESSVVKPGESIYYRTDSTTKKPGTGWVAFTVSSEQMDDANSLANTDFTLTEKGLFINGAMPIQVQNIDTRSGKVTWKTVKNFKLKTGEAIIGDGVKIRVAGTKAAWPGNEYTLKVDLDTGAITVTP